MNGMMKKSVLPIFQWCQLYSILMIWWTLSPFAKLLFNWDWRLNFLEIFSSNWLTKSSCCSTNLRFTLILFFYLTKLQMKLLLTMFIHNEPVQYLNTSRMLCGKLKFFVISDLSCLKFSLRKGKNFHNESRRSMNTARCYNTKCFIRMKL